MHRRRAAYFIAGLFPLLALAQSQAKPASPTRPDPAEPGGWYGLRLGGTKAEALTQLARLPHGQVQVREPVEPPFEVEPVPEDIRTETPWATASETLFSGLDGLGRHHPLSEGDVRFDPSIHLTIFGGRLVKIRLSDAYQVRSGSKVGAAVRDAAYLLKNRYGAALPNLICQDVSRAPSYTTENGKEIMISASSNLHCLFDKGAMDVEVGYFDIMTPRYRVDMAFTSSDGMLLEERQKRYSAVELGNGGVGLDQRHGPDHLGGGTLLQGRDGDRVRGAGRRLEATQAPLAHQDEAGASRDQREEEDDGDEALTHGILPGPWPGPGCRVRPGARRAPASSRSHPRAPGPGP